MNSEEPVGFQAAVEALNRRDRRDLVRRRLTTGTLCLRGAVMRFVGLGCSRTELPVPATSFRAYHAYVRPNLGEKKSALAPEQELSAKFAELKKTSSRCFYVPLVHLIGGGAHRPPAFRQSTPFMGCAVRPGICAIKTKGHAIKIAWPFKLMTAEGGAFNQLTAITEKRYQPRDPTPYPMLHRRLC